MIDTEILEDYGNEARELLEEMDDSLIRLEREGQSPELLNNIFRAVHCIKGSAEYIGLERSSALTHGVENVLDRVREGVMPLDARITDFLFRAKDAIARLVQEVTSRQEEETEISGLMAELDGFLQGPQESREDEESSEAAETAAASVTEDQMDASDTVDLKASTEDLQELGAGETEGSVLSNSSDAFYEGTSNPTAEQAIAPNNPVVTEAGEDTLNEALSDETETLGEEPTVDHVARLEQTGPQILNVALYLDDLQDGIPPQEVVGHLTKSVESLIRSLDSLGLPDAVLLLEAMLSNLDAVDPEQEVCPPEQIAELRKYLENLRSYYPEGFFPLEPTGEPKSDRFPVADSLSQTQSFQHAPFYHELMKVPGLDDAAAEAILKYGFTSREQLAQADIATLVRVGDLTPTMAEDVLQAMGSPSVRKVGQDGTRPKTREHSLLADVDDELLREFEGMFAGTETAEHQVAGNGRIDPLASELLGELHSLGEDTDREILEIFLAYGWEIMDKLRQASARIQTRNIQKDDLQTCADLIKSIRSSSNYMDFQRLASFLDDWHQKTVWATEQGSSLTPKDCRFMEESRARFEDFLAGLDAVLNQGALPVQQPVATASFAADTTQVEPSPSPVETDTGRTFESAATEEEPTMDHVPTDAGPTLEVPTVEKDSAPTEELLAPSAGRTAEVPAPAGLSAETAVVRTMRVDSAKVDVLLNQVGELVVNRSYVEQLSLELRSLYRQLQSFTQVGKKELLTVKNLSLKVGEASLALGRVANDIQEGVMKLRMLPIGQLFNRMPRLIRDLSRRVGKTVTLEVHGGDTEVDKRVIEQIYNPLVHLIRNAVDHGIEDTSTRKRMGKKHEGTVVLSAYSQGNQVVIDIEDDGAGIDSAAVIEKAVETRLVDESDAKNMGPLDVYNLLFTPGFSTSKRVTRTSGRGVGMDVVKKDVEKINGNVEISSESGAGTRVSIKIPLTLAIIQTLLIRVGKHMFAVPLTSVREILMVSPSDISTIEGFEVLKFRDETIPILRVNEVFNLKDFDRTREPKFLVLASAGSKTVGLLVEELVGEQDVVIKPLADHVFESRGLAGSTILGDGAIALVLDVTEMIEDVIAGQKQRAAMGGRSHGTGRLGGLRNGYKA